MDTPLPDFKQFRLPSNEIFQSRLSRKQYYCGPNRLWSIKTESLYAYSSALWSCLYYQSKIQTTFKWYVFKVDSQGNSIIVVPTVYGLSKQNLSKLLHQSFGNVSITSLKLMTRNDSWRVSQNTSLTFNYPAQFVSWPRQLKPLEVWPLMTQNLPLGSCFKHIFRFLVFKASVDLPRLFWIYVLLLCTPLGFQINTFVKI